MEIARHPYLEVLKFKEVFAFNFLELLPVADLPLICQALYDSKYFFSVVFGEAIQKFLGWAPAIGGDRELNRVKFTSV